MTIKHGHHPANVDLTGSDTWRHFNEGRAERVLIASPDLRVLFERSPDDYDPIGLARRYMGGADIVLTEGFKTAPLPKIEVFRRAAGFQAMHVPSKGAPEALMEVLADRVDFGLALRGGLVAGAGAGVVVGIGDQAHHPHLLVDHGHGERVRAGSE